MRLVTNLLLVFLISGLSILPLVGAVGLVTNDANDFQDWIFIVSGVVIPGISFYLLQARPWSEMLFQWFFWLGCLSLAVACAISWKQFESAFYWMSGEPIISEGLLFAWIILTFSALWEGLVCMAVALVQDHLRVRRHGFVRNVLNGSAPVQQPYATK